MVKISLTLISSLFLLNPRWRRNQNKTKSLVVLKFLAASDSDISNEAKNLASKLDNPAALEIQHWRQVYDQTTTVEIQEEWRS